MAGTSGISPIYFYLVAVLVGLLMGVLVFLAQHVKSLIVKHFLEESRSPGLPDHIKLPPPIEEELKRRRKHAQHNSN